MYIYFSNPSIFTAAQSFLSWMKPGWEHRPCQGSGLGLQTKRILGKDTWSNKNSTFTSVLLVLFCKVLIESIGSYQVIFLGAVNPSAVSRSPPVSYLQVYFLMVIWGEQQHKAGAVGCVNHCKSLCCCDSKRLCWRRRNKGILI